VTANLTAFDAAANGNYGALPATMTASDKMALAGAAGITVADLNSWMNQWGYVEGPDGNSYLTGGGAPQPQANTPVNFSSPAGNQPVTWADMNSLAGLPPGYGAPTFNQYGYTSSGRRRNNTANIAAGSVNPPVSAPWNVSTGG
jgi:hypothetical protein